MKTALTVAFLICFAALAAAQERLADQLRKGIVQEEANQSIEKAIQIYQGIVAQFDEDRKAAATALFRLAECYRKTGKREQAVAAYQRVVREFPEQAALVDPSRQHLASTYGLSEPRLARLTTPAAAGESRERALKTAQLDVASIQEKIKAYQAKITAGTASRDSAEYGQLNRDLEAARLRLKLAEAGVLEVRPAEPAASARESSEQATIAVYRDLRVKQLAVKAAERDMAAVEDKIKDYQMQIKNGRGSPDSTEFRQLRRDLEAARDQLDLARADLQEGEWKAAQPRPQEATPKSLRAAGPREVTPEMLDATRIEIDAMQKRLADMKARVEVGVVSPLDYQQLQAQFELLALRYREQLKTREANEATARETRALNERLIQSVETEIALLTRFINAAEKGVMKGYTSDSPELLKLRRDLLGLQRKLDELKADVKR